MSARLRSLQDQLRAVHWTASVLRGVRRQLTTKGLEASVEVPRHLSRRSLKAVNVTLRARRATCLERSLILQAYYAAHGIRREVVIGVRLDDRFSAHAWLDGADSQGHVELTRVKAPTTAERGADDGFSWAPSAYSLLLDRLAGSVVDTFAELGIDSLVLKGPTFTSWLWPDDQRGYGDLDLLVSPSSFERAANRLEELGFRDKLPSAARPAPDAARPMIDEDGLTIDLHRSIRGVGLDATAGWSVLWGRREPHEVGGALLDGLDEPARLVHVALHLASHLREEKPRADLQRAVDRIEPSQWAEAAVLAQVLDAVPGFVTGLHAAAGGLALLRELGLDGRPSVDELLRLDDAPDLALGLNRLIEMRGTLPRLQHLGRSIVSQPARPRGAEFDVGPGARGLAAAYLRRAARAAADTPRATRALVRARRADRRTRP